MGSAVVKEPSSEAPQEPLLASETEEANYVKNASAEIRNGFIRKVYSILCAQLLLTVVVGAIIYQHADWVERSRWALPAALVMSVVTMLAIVCCKQVSRKFPQNFIVLVVFTTCEGLLLGCGCSKYSAYQVIMSVFITCVVFGFLTMYACCTKTDFTGFDAYLFGALLALTLFGFTVPLLASAGLSFTALNLVFNIVGVLLFVFYIIYDTQLIMGEYGGHKEQFEIDDYIFASLNLYLDVVNMFLYILQMFGDR
jgi:FtsH-binding integral membrane protein